MVQGNDNRVVLKNLSGEAITFSLSIVRDDIPDTLNYSIQEFILHNRVNPAAIKFQPNYVPEYEGEVIRGRIVNMNEVASTESSVFLSAVGKELSVYAARVNGSTGEFSFFTNSLYGNREIVLEYPTSSEVSFELYDPFVKPPVKEVPPLMLNQKYETFLAKRSVEMQVSHRFGIDTLYDKITIFDDPFVYNNHPIVYPLDNYTRFPAMQDIMIEFITELRFRRVNNQPVLQVLLESNSGWVYSRNALAVIDGIAIFDHERLLQYDPLKVKSVTIYQNSYRIGNDVFYGIAKFDTYTGNYSGLTLGKNALIVDFKGVQYPSRFTGHQLASSDQLPDLRTLLYWDPQVEIGREASHEITLKASAVPGVYVIVLEGVTENGKPVYFRSEIPVHN